MDGWMDGWIRSSHSYSYSSHRIGIKRMIGRGIRGTIVYTSLMTKPWRI